jgi:hypothetical protein
MFITALLLPAPLPAAPTTLQLAIAIPESDMPLGIKDRQVNMYVTFSSTAAANGKGSDLRFWGEGCSWGYECLSFEVSPVDGGPLKIVKRLPRGWDKNHPYTLNVTPGRHFSRPVAFGDGTWGPFPLATGGVGHFRIRAVYQISPDDVTKEFKVWTGRAESPWELVDFRNHMAGGQQSQSR